MSPPYFFYVKDCILGIFWGNTSLDHTAHSEVVEFLFLLNVTTI